MPLSARLADLFNFCQVPRGFDLMQICVPDSIGFRKDYEALDIGLISKSLCFGCLCCLEKGDAIAFDKNGVPSKLDNDKQFTKISSTLFKGKYVNVSPNPTKYWKHTSSNEKEHTTPISANLLVFLSKRENNILIRCSPNWELSIDTTDSEDPREGHLDLIIVNCEKKKVLVAEVKSSVTNLLRDRRRDQWDRYNKEIEKETYKRGYDSIFLYIIGGDEYSLYPASIEGIPISPTNRRDEFYEFIKKGNKHFISVEALRALKVQKLSTHNNWAWEEWFFKIYSERFLGLISGGLVDNNLKLQMCPW